MKNVLKSCGYFLYFLIASLIGAISVLLFTLYTNESWTVQTYDALRSNDMELYLKCILEITPETLLLTDVLIIVPFLFLKIKQKEQIIKRTSMTNIFFMLFVGLLLNFVVTVCCTYVPFPKSWQQDLSLFTGAAVSMHPVMSSVCTGLLAPVMEEIIFRYGVFNKLKQKNLTVALVVSSLLFGMMHGNIIQGGYAFLIGMIIAYIYNKTENLLDAILIHVGVNLSSVIFTFTDFNEILYLLSLTVIFGIASFVMVKKQKEVINYSA